MVQNDRRNKAYSSQLKLQFAAGRKLLSVYLGFLNVTRKEVHCMQTWPCVTPQHECQQWRSGASVVSWFLFSNKIGIYWIIRIMGYTGSLLQLLFVPWIGLGEQMVNVDNLLGSGVTHVQLPVLPVWYWEHYGVESCVEFEGSRKMSITIHQKGKSYYMASAPSSHHSATNVNITSLLHGQYLVPWLNSKIQWVFCRASNQ